MKFLMRLSLLCLVTLASIPLFASSRLSVPTYVCNPGAAVRVPISLTTDMPCATVDLRLAYDAQVLVPVKLEAGCLAARFTDDPVLGYETAGLVTAALLATNDVASVTGTVAVVTFRVREGTAGLFSDLTPASVSLGTATGLDAEPAANPVAITPGMIRVVSSAAAVARLESAQIVCGETSLGSLAVSDGDALAASDDLSPIVVSNAVIASAAIPVAAPPSGWGTGAYPLLKTPTAGLTFVPASLSPEDAFSVTSAVDSAGLTTYVANVAIAGAIAVTTATDADGTSEAPVATANKLRRIYELECSADATFAAQLGAYKARGKTLKGIKATVTGTAKSSDIPTYVDLGIAGAPSFDAELGIIEFTYAEPKLEIVAFTPLGDGTATARIRVTPGTGNCIRQQIQTGCLHLYGTTDLNTAMSLKSGVTFDLAPYMTSGSLGEATLTISLGDSSFFRVKAGE